MDSHGGNIVLLITMSEMYRAIRAELGLSQAEMASILGVHVDSVLRWETGKAEPKPYLLPYLLLLLEPDNLMAAIERCDDDDLIQSFKHQRTCGHCGKSTRKGRGFRK